MSYHGNKAKLARPVSWRTFWIFHGGYVLLLFAVMSLVGHCEVGS